MSNRVERAFEALLILAVLATIAFGATWVNGSPISLRAQSLPAVAAPSDAAAQAAPGAQVPGSEPAAANPTPPAPDLNATVAVTATDTISGNLGAASNVATPVAFDANFGADRIDDNDAPLLKQSAGTINFLLLGSDDSPDGRWARTDSIIVASIATEGPSVSMLSLPRDLHVRIPGYGKDRINTVYERGVADNFPGGGPAFVALVLRKNFGIRIDHFVQIDFKGFVTAVDTLGGVEVLAECELHDTFPDPANPKSKVGIDLDVYPGKVKLTGQQALWFSRSRWSTSDFDRARRQQKVLRAALRKAKESNQLANALGLFGELRQYISTDVGITDIPAFIAIAQGLDNLAIKSRVITFPVVKTLVRNDGAYVLDPQPDILAYVAEALAPPAANRTQTRIGVEVVNGSSKQDMELVAAERLAWEGFAVLEISKIDERFPETQVIDYGTTPKASSIPRLSSIFSVQRKNVIGAADPSSKAAARIVIGENYNSCPNTASIAGDVVVGKQDVKQVDTPTP